MSRIIYDETTDEYTSDSEMDVIEETTTQYRGAIMKDSDVTEVTSPASGARCSDYAIRSPGTSRSKPITGRRRSSESPPYKRASRVLTINPTRQRRSTAKNSLNKQEPHDDCRTGRHAVPSSSKRRAKTGVASTQVVPDERGSDDAAHLSGVRSDGLASARRRTDGSALTNMGAEEYHQELSHDEAMGLTFRAFCEQLRLLDKRPMINRAAPQIDEAIILLPPVGANPAAFEYGVFPLADLKIDPVDVALLMYCAVEAGIQKDSLRLTLVRDGPSLRKELSRYQCFEFTWAGHPTPHQVAHMFDDRALRRGYFMMALFYRGHCFCVQCGHRTVKHDQHGFCVLCLYVHIRDNNIKRLPCHLLYDEAGRLICENCAAMPKGAFLKRVFEYEKIEQLDKAGKRFPEPDTLPLYGWSPLHVNAASVVDIHQQLTHFGIALPTSVEQAEQAAAALKRADALYTRERRAYKRLSKENRGNKRFAQADKPNASDVAAQRRKLFEKARTAGAHILFPERLRPIPLVHGDARGSGSDDAAPKSLVFPCQPAVVTPEEQHLAARASHAQANGVVTLPKLETAGRLNTRIGSVARQKKFSTADHHDTHRALLDRVTVEIRDIVDPHQRTVKLNTRKPTAVTTPATRRDNLTDVVTMSGHVKKVSCSAPVTATATMGEKFSTIPPLSTPTSEMLDERSVKSEAVMRPQNVEASPVLKRMPARPGVSTFREDVVSPVSSVVTPRDVTSEHDDKRDHEAVTSLAGDQPGDHNSEELEPIENLIKKAEQIWRANEASMAQGVNTSKAQCDASHLAALGNFEADNASGASSYPSALISRTDVVAASVFTSTPTPTLGGGRHEHLRQQEDLHRFTGPSLPYSAPRSTVTSALSSSPPRAVPAGGALSRPAPCTIRPLIMPSLHNVQRVPVLRPPLATTRSAPPYEFVPNGGLPPTSQPTTRIHAGRSPVYSFQAPVLHLFVTPAQLGTPLTIPLQQMLSLEVVVHTSASDMAHPPHPHPSQQ